MSDYTKRRDGDPYTYKKIAGKKGLNVVISSFFPDPSDCFVVAGPGRNDSPAVDARVLSLVTGNKSE